MKVQWKNHLVEEFTWEIGVDMCKRYLYLIVNSSTPSYPYFYFDLSGMNGENFGI